MLSKITHTNSRVKDEVIYLVSQAHLIEKAGIPFVFTDAHAMMDFLLFRNQLIDLTIVDWEVMQARYWSSTRGDNDRRRRRMVEFLVHQHFPVSYIRAIVVASVAKAVQQQLINFASQIPVRIQPDWYF